MLMEFKERTTFQMRRGLFICRMVKVYAYPACNRLCTSQNIYPNSLYGYLTANLKQW